MKLKKHIIIIIMFFVLITSFMAVYLTLKYNNQITSKDNIARAKALDNVLDNTVKNTSVDTIALINEKTQIIKTYKYKDNINKQYIETPGPELLGLDREGARQYFKAKDFLLTEFSNKRVSLLSQSDTWAPNYYVIKSDGSLIIVYHSNEKGELKLEYKTQINPQDLPLEDRKLFEEGKAFKSIDEVNKVLEELNS
jgi:hypothetical protein